MIMHVNIKIFYLKKFSIQVIKHAKMIFISHLQTLQILNKAKFHAFFEKFSHWKLKPAPTQDKFLDFLQNEFSHSKCVQRAFFHLNGGQRFALARGRIGTHPHSSEKSYLETFWVWKFILQKVKEFILSRGWFQL